MILTQCAVCATELGLSLGKKCGRCSTRYCGPECQKQHWESGGHDKLCKKIKKEGGAEQYNANKNYAEAVVVAAEACADDTKGQTCFICTQALHWKTKEGLVRGCSCRGTAGLAHVSCLAEQAKILVAEAEENNLDNKAWNERFGRWHTCRICEQEYHGVVRCALGWACWKTYVGRTEGDWTRDAAMGQLGNGLGAVGHHADALSVRGTQLAIKQRLGASQESILDMQSNLATSYGYVGRLEDASRVQQDVYSGFLKLNGNEDETTLQAANNYAASLVTLERYKEAQSVLRKMIPLAQRVFGESNDLALRMRSIYAAALYMDTCATLDDLHEAVTTLEETERTARRVLGGAHPLTTAVEGDLRHARAALAAREVSSLGEDMAAMTPRDAQDDPTS